jgi:hypothetical protein
MKSVMKLFFVTLVCVSLVPIASATLCTTAGTFESDLTTISVGGVQGSGFYGSVCVSDFNSTAQTATITFIAASGYSFIDGSAADVTTNGGLATPAFVSETPKAGSVSDFKDFTSVGHVDGYGTMNVQLNDNSSSQLEQVIVFTVHNTSGTTWTSNSNVLAFNPSGFDAAAHVVGADCGTSLTCFVGENTGGTTVPEPRFYGLLLTGLMALVGKTLFRRRAA